MVKKTFIVDAKGKWLEQAISICPQLSKAKLQMQFVDLKSNDELQLQFKQSHDSSATIYTDLRTLALTVSGMFGTTYICEQSFSRIYEHY